MNKNQLITGVIALTVVILAVVLWSGRRAAQIIPLVEITTTTSSSVATTNETAATNTIKSIISSIFKPITPAEFNPRDPWQVLDRYFTFTKAHNIAGVKSLSYQQSAACADAKREQECFSLMDGVSAFKNRLKPDDFPIKWEDAKQLILLTPIFKDDSVGYGYRQGVIIFTKTVDGELRLLTFNPDRAWYLTSVLNDNPEGQESRIRPMMEDVDQDAKDDRVEACVGEPDDCVKTDPTRRDTDGDGWWDGVEAYFNKV